MQHTVNAVVGAEEGYINSLQRQLARSKSQLQAVENMYQKQILKSDTTLAALTEQLHESQAQLVQLSQEKAALQQTCELAEREKQMALQSLHGMKEKCESLTVERDKAMKEGTSLQLSLQKAKQEVAMLKEKRDDSLASEPPAEVFSELAGMRRVIGSRKKMVLAQREHLASQGVSLSMRSKLSQPAAPSKGLSKKGLDRKCPVCGQDFAHITMDEFQTHVFECFADADDTSSAPETLQPQPTSPSKPGVSLDRIFPMCERRFDDTVSKRYFEEHVQSHFEEVANHFEVLDVHRP